MFFKQCSGIDRFFILIFVMGLVFKLKIGTRMSTECRHQNTNHSLLAPKRYPITNYTYQSWYNILEFGCQKWKMNTKSSKGGFRRAQRPSAASATTVVLSYTTAAVDHGLYGIIFQLLSAVTLHLIVLVFSFQWRFFFSEQSSVKKIVW